MSGEGQHLENLVRQVEELLLPKGFSVAGNSRVYNDENVQIAEFDIEVRGRLGSTYISWLIECRDRPGSGPAPGSWIEQLVGRRDRFRFSKVTAVSTTGFALGAEEYAVGDLAGMMGAGDLEHILRQIDSDGGRFSHGLHHPRL